MSEHYTYGRRKEIQIGECLERRGFGWDRSAGSRGPADIYAQRGRRKLAIQVKATRGDSIDYARLTVREERSLIRVARRTGAEPVAAFVVRNDVWFVGVRDGEVIDKAKLRAQKYDYYDER